MVKGNVNVSANAGIKTSGSGQAPVVVKTIFGTALDGSVFGAKEGRIGLTAVGKEGGIDKVFIHGRRSRHGAAVAARVKARLCGKASVSVFCVC